MGFSQSGDEKNDEAEELRHNKPETALCLDDVRQVEGACKRDRTHERQPHEDFVAYQLSGGAKASQKCELAVRGPATDDHAVSRKTGHGQKEQDSNVDVGHDKPWCDRDHGKRHQRRDDDDGGCQHEDDLIGERGNPIFFGENFDHVGE